MDGRYMPLTMVYPGREVTLIGITRGRGIRARLAGMGLTPGAKLSVLRTGPGPLMVAVRDTRLALGHGMAHKIIVE